MVEDAISFWTDIQRYENTLSSDPASYCFAPLSELYRKLGLLDDAISVAQKGCALHPDYPVGFYALGAAYYNKGLKNDSRQALERVVSLDPDHTEALKLLGQIFVESGEIELARKTLADLVARDPEDTESALLLRSIGAPVQGAEPEEILEEADIIEDLDEVLDEAPPAGQPADSGLAEVARALSEYDWVAAPPAAGPSAQPERYGQADTFEEGEDLWGVEGAQEQPEEMWEAEEFAEEEPAPLQQGGAAPPGAPGTAAPSAAGPEGRDPLTTATLAELYVSQGFLEKATAVYRELIKADPGNHGYQLRYAELREQQQLLASAAPEPAPRSHPARQPDTAPPAMVRMEEQPAAAPPGDIGTELNRWLENIRRRRDGV